MNIQITLISWVLIIIGLLTFFIKPRLLYYLMIFFIPFSATSIMNFPEYKFSILASMYFGALWVISKINIMLLSGKLKVRMPAKLLLLLFLFFIVTLLSLLMPFFIDNKLSVWEQDYAKGNPLHFEFWYLISLAFIAYGVFIAVFVTEINTDILRFKNTIRVYLLSGFIVTIIGFIEIILYYFNLPNPFYIFVNSVSSLNHTRVISDYLAGLQIMRVSSVAEEPSIFSQHILGMLPIMFFVVLGKYRIFSLNLDKLILVSFITILIISTSATAYFGLAAMLLFIFIFFKKEISFKKSYKIIFVGFILLLILLFMQNELMRNFFHHYLLGKLTTDSGISRISVMQRSMGYFFKYPILGIGLGVVTINDLFAGLLSGVGILGLAIFSSLVVVTLNSLKKIAKFGNKNESKNGLSFLAVGLFISILTYLFAAQSSGFHYRLTDFWFLIGLANALPFIYHKEA